MTMLDRMRRHKGWLKWSLALVVLTFVAFYIPSFLDTNGNTVGATPREVIAEVDGHDLTAGDFQSRYQQQLQQYQQQFGGSINEQLLRQLGIDQQILAQMVDDEVAVIEADRHHITVSDDELAQAIFAIPGLQEGGKFIGEQRYEQLLRMQRPPLTKAQFEESVRRDLLLSKLRSALTDWITVSDADVQKEYKQRNEKVKLQIVAVTADKFRDKVTVTDADVSSYFDAHKAEYRIGEQRKVKYLLLDRDQARARVVVTPQDVDRYYNQNIQQFQTPEQVRASHILLKTEGKNENEVRKKAEEILQKAKAPGADFAALARQYSEDTTKDAGGDLGLFGKGRMVPEFDRVAFTLEPGQISDLVKTEYGYHIIKVTEHQPAKTTPLEQVRAQIQNQLQTQMADQQITDKAQALAGQIKTPADLDKVAQEQGLQVQESGFFQRDDPVPGIGAAPQVAQAAFKLKEGEVSEPVNSSRGPVFVTLSGKKDPYVPKLDEVKDKVREDVIRTRAADMSRQKAGEIAAALKNAKDFTAAAKAQGLDAKETDLITRGSALPDIGVSPEVDAAAFALPVGGVSDPIRTSDATVIVRVESREDVTPQKLSDEKETFRDQLLTERRNRFFTAYMTKAKEKMKIEVKQDVLRRVTAQNQL